MTKVEKLEEKLANGTIDAQELRSLLRKKGFEIERRKGSHEVWTKGERTLVLATHSQDLKPYQIKQAREALK